ncbi:MAG TPA: phage tail tape measure protein [Candidatus Glassbacteria bacterium]|nr:phage tail tape measure protein [Candidatus Glassbacteria bacterium]
MPSKIAKADANFQGVITELQKVIKEIQKLSTAQDKLVKGVDAVVRGINAQATAVEKLAKSHQKLNASVKQQSQSQKKLKKTTEDTSKSIINQKNKIKQQESARARETKAIDRNVNQGYTKNFLRGTGATFDETLNYKNQQAAFNKFVTSQGIGLNQVNSMWKRLATGDIRAYQGKLGDLQNNLVALRKSQVALGTSARKMNDAQTDAWAKQNLGAGRAKTSLQRVDEGIRKITISWGSFARLLAVQLFHQAVSVAVRSLAEGVRTVIELEKRIGEVQTISQHLPLTTEKWYEGFKKLSDFWGISILDQAEAAYQALSNQVVEGAQTLEFLETANKFATITVTDTSTAVNLLTAAINSFAKDAYDAEQISSELFKTIELGRVRAEEMATSYGRIAVPAHKLGITMTELNAAISTATIQGFKYSEAATSIRNVFLKLIKPTEEMAKWFEELGVVSGEALIHAYGFQGALVALTEKAKDSVTDLGKLFGRLRAMMGAFLLQGEGLAIYIKNLLEIKDATEAYDKSLSQILEKTGKQLDIQFNKIKNWFTDTSRDIIIFVGEWTENFQKITDIIKVLATTITVFAIPAILGLGLALKALLLATGPVGIFLTVLGLLAAQIAIAYQVAENKERKIDEITEKNIKEWHKQRMKSIDETFGARQKAIDKAHRNEMGKSQIWASFAAKQIKEHGAAYEKFRKNITSFEKSIAKVIKGRVKSLKDQIKELNEIIAEKPFDAVEAEDYISERRASGKDRPGREEYETERKYEQTVGRLLGAEERLRSASAKLSKDDFEDAEKQIQDFAKKAIDLSDQVFDEGKTGAISSGEAFYRYWLQVITDQKSLMDTRANRLKDTLVNEKSYHENNLELIKKQVEAVKETTIQELFKEKDPEKIKEVYNTQAKALEKLKTLAKEYGVEFSEFHDLESELVSLKIFQENRLIKLKEDAFQNEQIRLKKAADEQHQQIKTLWKAWVDLAKKARESQDEILQWEERKIRQVVTDSGPDLQSAGKTSIIRRAAGGLAGIDTQMVAMSPQEMIMNPRASRHFFSTLTAINSGFQRFAGGGAPVTYNVGDINLHPQSASDVNVVSLGQKMRREIRRGRLRLN